MLVGILRLITFSAGRNKATVKTGPYHVADKTMGF